MATRGTFTKTRIELGPCECPGSPHTDGDWAEVKQRLQFGDVRRIAAAMFAGDLVGTATMLGRAIVAWNLVDDKGQPVPIPVLPNGDTDLTAIDELSVEQSQALRVVLDSEEYAVQLRAAPLPNPPSGPSADGSAPSSDPTTTTSPTSSPTTF